MTTISEHTKQAKSFSLKKEERLSSKKCIDKLFAEGDSALQYPLKMVFLKTELQTKYPVQAGFTVSKKIFKRAVARNRIKRLLRETYRLNKHLIYTELKQEQLALFIIFIGKELPKYEIVEVAMKKGLSKIIKKISNKNLIENGEQN
jgi:ribonuclease P protein component